MNWHNDASKLLMIQPNKDNINKANECLKNFSSLSDTFIIKKKCY
jgi:hypothetical protein